MIFLFIQILNSTFNLFYYIIATLPFFIKTLLRVVAQLQWERKHINNALKTKLLQ